MKSFAILFVVLLASCHHCNGFLCYTQEGDGFRGITFCTNSCYSTGAQVFGFSKIKKGCADNSYNEICQAAGFLGVSEHACFCNGFLCNSSSAPSLFLPLLLIPYLIQKILA